MTVISNSATYLLAGIAVFLLGAFHLALPSGYSVGAAVLLLMGLYSLRPLAYFKDRLSTQDLWILAALVIFGLNGIFDAVYHQASGSNYDKASRFLLAIPVYFALRKYPPRLEWLWAGLIVGALATFLLASWQVWGLNHARAQGHTHPIQFGNLSMLSGFFCLAGLGWATQLPTNKQRTQWFLFLLGGAALGLLSSLLSGSRGGWISIPFVALILIKAYHSFFSVRLKLGALFAAVILGFGLYQMPAFKIQQRVHAAFHDIELYQQGQTDTSLGARFEMWKAALYMAKERPILGWGKDQMQSTMQDLAAQGLADPVIGTFNHAHNEVLDTLAKRGVVGLMALALLYLIPIRLFASYLGHPCLATRSLATAGMILPVAYIDFGLSQTFLAHNSGIMVYGFWLLVFWACLRNTICAHTGPAPTGP